MEAVYVLGISCFRDDATAALLHDGAIVAIAEEERFVRVKHAVYEPPRPFVTSVGESEPLHDFEIFFFPERAIEYVLSEAGIEHTDVDCVAYDLDLESRIARFEDFEPVSSLLSAEEGERLKESWRYWLRTLRAFADRCRARFVVVPHHVAHASGTVFGSGFERPSFVVVDALGELTSATLGSFDGDFRVHASVALPHSLGLAYAAVTTYLGFRPFSDEQKTMALAGYGDDSMRTEMEKVVWPVEHGLATAPELVWTDDVKMGVRRPPALASVFAAPPRPPGVSPLDAPYPDVAASLQAQTERIAFHLLDVLERAAPLRSLCLAGGVALNSQMNGAVAQDARVEEMFVQPQAGDSGTALGAAYHAFFAATGARPEPLRHAYWGRGYGDREIRAVLERLKLPFRKPPDLCHEVARLVAGGKVVGWFQGRSECGPRALGNRSILADCSREGIDGYVNDRVKDRERWRPFAASMLDEDRALYLECDVPAPYMLLALPLTARGRRDVVAASHVDGTTRAQTVTASQNPRFHRLLTELKGLTGRGVVLNTSFNVKGEPIVDHPIEAVRDFYATGLDALALGDYLLDKEPL